MLAAGFFFGALDMKTDFGERIARLESKLDLFESTVRKQLIAKAQDLLGTTDVQVALINQRSDIIIPISEKRPPLALSGAKDEKGWFVNYEIEAVKNRSVILRVKVEQEFQGKVTRTIYDQRAEILIPIDEKWVRYDFKLDDKGVIPEVRLEIVVLEQVSPDTLMIAIALGLTPEKTKT